MTTDFAFVRQLVHSTSGLDLGPDKRYLAESRLAPVWRAEGLASLGELVREIRRPDRATLRQAVVEAMATNETTFFRDKPVFDSLRDVVLPRLVAARAGTRRLRIWSAAASTGQEAYSVAMTLVDMAPALEGWTVSILGTDISTGVLARARAGVYSQLEVQRGLPIRTLLRHFEQVPHGWSVSAEVRKAVEFRAFNLLDDTRPLGRFDLVLCRNLLIYLDARTKASVLAKLAAATLPEGALCLGASETSLGLSAALACDPSAPGFLRHRAGDVARRAAAG